MKRLANRLVLITGATAGIGEACAEAFAGHGSRLILAARRGGRLDALAERLKDAHGAEVHTQALDVSDRDAVGRWGEALRAEGLEPDVLVNNAGLARGLDPVQSGSLDDWDEMVDTNVKGLLYVTRQFLPAMVARDEGHVVNIGSISGRWLYPKGAVYCATKFSVKALTEGLNMDLVGTGVRVSSVDPGLVETEFSEVRFHGDEERAAAVYQGYRPLAPADVADVVCWVVNAPPHVDIFNVVVMPTDQRHAMVLHKDGGSEG